MLRLFRHIPSESLINRILGLSRISPRAVWDGIYVETKKRSNPHRAFRYGICRNLVMATNHMAYQPAVGHGLRHAVLYLNSNFYRYAVSRMARELRPTGQPASIKSFNPKNPRFSC